MQRVINYDDVIAVKIHVYDEYHNVNIPESAVNKALMIAMNYLIENMETDKEESAE